MNIEVTVWDPAQNRVRVVARTFDMVRADRAGRAACRALGAPLFAVWDMSKSETEGEIFLPNGRSLYDVA